MITGPSSYDSTMAEFKKHWLSANTKLAPTPLILTLPDKTSMTQAQFATLHATLLTQQDTLQTWAVDVQIARGNVNVKKVELLAKFNLFTALMDGSYQGTGFYEARPLAPGVTYGKELFLKPLGDAMKLWKRMNESAAPAGVTLPLVLGDGTNQGAFASEISALCFAYADLEDKEVDLRIARGNRNVTQTRAYAAMKMYREGAENKFVMHPELIETLPRLTPLPGHTPDAVNASAVLEGTNQAKVVYDASTDAMLESYELRGSAGDDYNDEDAVVIATNAPGAPREFVTPFGLNQPGAKIALKVYVILTTGNEAGSAAMFVERPASVQLAA
jgi:hypothetical protein